jgi:succinate dehydrogenase / fumarate reductase iron-sulfur subunit
MAEYTLKVRRFQPESGEGPYWEQFEVELDPSLSVLDGLLQAKDRDDGSLGVRCSCRAAICGSCGVKINGSSTLACKTQIGEAFAAANRRNRGNGTPRPRGADEDYTPTGGTGGTPGRGSEGAERDARTRERTEESGTAPGRGSNGGSISDSPAVAGAEEAAPIVIEPMGNMPVIKDLITDMESTHWTKIRRVTPWLLPHGEAPEREYVVEPESMIDITQSMACIQCGACVSSCLSMEVDPDFIGPAALAKAYRFVGDPRDAETRERLHDLAYDPHGIYDCTHCFSCIDACPKGVAPMDQIMRLRRKAEEEGVEKDPNNGHNHMAAFTSIIEKKGTLDEALLLQESYAPGVKGKLKPTKGAIKGLLASIPTGVRAFRSGKARSLSKLIPGVHPQLPGGAQDEVRAIYRHAEEHGEELNLYIKGEEGDEEAAVAERLEPTEEGQ